MGKVYVKRENTTKHPVKKGDTLDKIAQKFSDVASWKELALYNWGTDFPREVNRALIETVGCSKIRWSNPGRTVLNPDPTTPAEILVPKLWKKGSYAQKQQHVIRVKPLPLPAPAIKITKLDKWFIPGTENCTVGYVVEGIKERASKVDLEVHASNYCKAAATAKGEFLEYAYTASTAPICEQALQADCAPRQRLSKDWDGKSEAKEGVLKPRTGETRYINVACSPYTVMLRYYREAARKNAKLFLDAFWPQFDDTGKVTDDSLKIKWRIEGATDLKLGMVVVWDKDDRRVYHGALAAGDVGNGPHEYDWAAKGGNKIVKKDKMPYRVQIQAHTDMNNDDGLGLAAMHTEVRLYVHKDIGSHPAEPVKEPQCLEFALAAFLPYRNVVTDKPAEGTDEWYKLQLAAAGLHPGPVGKDADPAPFPLALKEFQRSFPKIGAAPHKRIKADGAKNDDTKAAVKILKANTRPMFGNPANREDYTPAQALPLLKDKTKDLIVWVDDRHYYTKPWNGGDVWRPAVGEYGAAPKFNATLKDIVDLYDMENYRGKMSIGDVRLTKDEASIARPWIPVEMKMALLAKGTPLEATTAMPPVTDEMRRAIGPLRVDWTFEELPAETSHIPLGTDRTVGKIEIPASHTGGTFTLTFFGWTTANIARAATAAQVQTALRNLGVFSTPKLKNGVAVTGPNGGPWIVVFEPPTWPTTVTQITITGADLTGGAVTVAAQVAGGVHSQALVTVPAGVGGTFKLTFNAGTTAAPLARNATGAAIQTALRALATVPNAHKPKVTVAGVAGGPWTVTFATGFPGPAAGTITGDGAALTGTGGSVTVGAQPAGGPHSKAQVTLSAGPGGTFKLTFNYATTPALARASTGANIQTALRALGSILGADKPKVTVVGPAGGPWVVTFADGFTCPAASTITGDGATLTQTGGTVTVVAQVAGGVQSKALVTPSAGPGGTFKLTFNGAPTPALARSVAGAAIQTALRALATVPDAHKAKVTVAGVAGGPWTVTFATGFPGPAAGTITGDGSTLTRTGGSATVAAQPPGGPHSKALVTLSIGPGGTFTLTFNGAPTPALARNASAADVQTALRALGTVPNAHKPKVTVTGVAGGPWTVTFDAGFPGPAASTITGSGTTLTGGATAVIPVKQKVTRARKYMEEILTKEAPAGYAKKLGAKLYVNCPEKIGVNNIGGIRPTDLTKYYKAPFVFDKTGSLLPWLAYDDSTAKAVCTTVHDDLGQDPKKVYPDFVGKAGVYLHPSRIAGDGYQYRAQVSFKKLPGTAGDHLNRQVLEKRYAKLPQAHTARMRLWRKTSFRGYVSWVKTVVAAWERAMDQVDEFYNSAHVHFIHEGPDPKAHQQCPTTGGAKLVSAAEYKQLVKKQLTGTAYDAIRNDAQLTEGYIWPFLHKAHYGLARHIGNLAAFSGWLYGTLELDSWDKYSMELIHLIAAKMESTHGRMRGHVMAEFNSSPPLYLIEYTCNNVACGDVISDVANDPAGASNVNIDGTNVKYTRRYHNADCRLKPGGCAGKYQAGATDNIEAGLPLCAIGQPIGGSWLYTPRRTETWAHEVGHHRHFQHAQAYANKATKAPGGEVKQHDSAAHPAMTAAGLSAFQRAWDRFCVMSYDKGAARFFCGKCLLRNRGWAVENVTNPNGALHD